jgi:PEP-CTERM motif
MKSMRKLLGPMMAAALSVAASSVQATLFDFKAAADGSYGESAWSQFDLSTFGSDGVNVKITGTKDGSDAFVYLDSDKAGMGVCGSLNSSGTANLGKQLAKSGANLCSQSDDDNVTSGEKLNFAFNESVAIDKIWFNNNHDGDLSLMGDFITIFGVDFMFVATDLSRGNDAMYVPVTPIIFAAGDNGEIAFYSGVPTLSAANGEEFYLSAIDINRVPEPGTLALLGFAIAGLGFARSRKLH